MAQTYLASTYNTEVRNTGGEGHVEKRMDAQNNLRNKKAVYSTPRKSEGNPWKIGYSF